MTQNVGNGSDIEYGDFHQADNKIVNAKGVTDNYAPLDIESVVTGMDVTPQDFSTESDDIVPSDDEDELLSPGEFNS
jgi:hypothetical protein